MCSSTLIKNRFIRGSGGYTASGEAVVSAIGDTPHVATVSSPIKRHSSTPPRTDSSARAQSAWWRHTRVFRQAIRSDKPFSSRHQLTTVLQHLFPSEFTDHSNTESVWQLQPIVAQTVRQHVSYEVIWIRIQLNVHYCVLFSSSVRSRIRVMIRFSVLLASCYAHVFVRLRL